MTPLQPERVLAIILGASEWPKFEGLETRLEASQAFKNSAEGFREYLEKRLRVAKDNLLWLFDTNLTQNDVDAQIDDFLQKGAARLGTREGKDSSPGDVILFFTGHGRITTGEPKFQFILRSTRSANPGNSGYLMSHLAATLNSHVRSWRKWAFLDCCFSGRAHVDLMPQSDFRLAVRREADEVLPPARGTALLAACAGDRVALAPENQPRTMFSGMLLDVLNQGDPQLGEWLSLEQIAERVETKIQHEFAHDAVKPVLSLPDESKGSIAKHPFFPNPAKETAGQSTAIQAIHDRLNGIVLGQAMLKEQVQGMLNHLVWQVRGLDESQSEFVKEIARLTGATIEIRHIGLDLFKAHEKMARMLNEHFPVKKAVLKILVITSDLKKIRYAYPLPKAVRTMVGRVKTAVTELELHFMKLDKQFRTRDQELTVEIKCYTTLPVIHGFSLREGKEAEKHVATYFSFCRWDNDGDLLWGSDGYRRIMGEPGDPYLNDSRAIFDGEFQHLWRNGKRLFHHVIGGPRLASSSGK